MQTNKDKIFPKHYWLLALLAALFYAICIIKWTTANITFDPFDADFHYHNLIYFKIMFQNSFNIFKATQFLPAHHPPLTHILNAIIIHFLGVKAHWVLNMLLFICCFLLTARIIAHLNHPEKYWELALCFIFFFTPTLFHTAFVYTIEAAVVFFVLLYYDLIVLKKRYHFLGIVVGLGCLTKTVFLFFIIGDLIIRIKDLKKKKNLLFPQLAIILLICGWWYIPRGMDIFQGIKLNASLDLIDNATTPNYFENALYYLTGIIQLLPIPLAVLFVISLFYNLKTSLISFTSWIIIPTMLFTFFGILGTKKIEYILPLFPAILLSTLIAIQKLPNKILKALIFSVLIVAQLFYLKQTKQFYPKNQNFLYRYKETLAPIKNALKENIRIGIYSNIYIPETYMAFLFHETPTLSNQMLSKTPNLNYYILDDTRADMLEGAIDKTDAFYFIANLPLNKTATHIMKLLESAGFKEEKKVSAPQKHTFIYFKKHRRKKTSSTS